MVLEPIATILSGEIDTLVEGERPLGNTLEEGDFFKQNPGVANEDDAFDWKKLVMGVNP